MSRPLQGVSAHLPVEEPPRTRQVHPKDSFHPPTLPYPERGGGGGGGTVLYCVADFRVDPCRTVMCVLCLTDQPLSTRRYPVRLGRKNYCEPQGIPVSRSGWHTPSTVRRPCHGKDTMLLTPACVLEKLVDARRTRK